MVVKYDKVYSCGHYSVKEDPPSVFVPKASFILQCICVAVSCSARISVFAPTTALRYCIHFILIWGALGWAAVDIDQYIGNAAEVQWSMNAA